jgi:transposase
MNQYSTVIGIDAHADTNTVYAMDKTTGTIAEKRLSADPAVLLQWMKTAQLSEPVGCCYESGPTGFYLARELGKANIDCHIAAVSRLPQRRDGKKNDPMDAKTLAHLFEAGQTTDVWVPPVEVEAHKNLSRLRAHASKDLAKSKQRVTSLLLTKGVRFEEGNWTLAWRKKVKALHLSDPCDDYVLEEYLAEVSHLEGRLKAIEDRTEAFIAAHTEYAQTIARLDSIGGIAKTTAFAFAVEIGDFTRFKSSGAFASYIGLTPSESSTGPHHRTGCITKCGNRYLRYLLIEAVSVYARNINLEKNIDVGLDPYVRSEIAKCNKRLKKRQQALKKRGKQANKVKVALARELACWIWHIATL